MEIDNNNALNLATAAYGNKPVPSGIGVVNFSHNARAYRAYENTTISEFRDVDNNVIVTGWEGVTIEPFNFAVFSTYIKSIIVTSGGRGCIYL